jgi:hypothetical protein
MTKDVKDLKVGDVVRPYGKITSMHKEPPIPVGRCVTVRFNETFTVSWPVGFRIEVEESQ